MLYITIITVKYKSFARINSLSSDWQCRCCGTIHQEYVCCGGLWKLQDKGQNRGAISFNTGAFIILALERCGCHLWRTQAHHLITVHTGTSVTFQKWHVCGDLFLFFWVQRHWLAMHAVNLLWGAMKEVQWHKIMKGGDGAPTCNGRLLAIQ